MLYMRRQATDFISEWYKSENRKPLVLRGARQVGKSSLVELFCKEQNINLFVVNLEKRKLSKLNQVDVNKILQEVEVICNKPWGPNSVIFFDEIQAQPEVLSYLRYFHEDLPSVPVLAAGSLLDFALREHLLSMPVGRIQYFFLGPMSFSEFLVAFGQDKLIKILQSMEPIDEEIHNILLRYLKEYLYVGGMPEAVKEFQKNQSLVVAREVHYSILQTYQDDFTKYSKHSKLSQIQRVFDYAPRRLGEKVKFSEIDPDARSADVKNAIDLLTMARVLTKCFHSNGKDISLRASSDTSVYKLFHLDVGLVSTLVNIDWMQINEDVSKPFKGKILEQFVAQHFLFWEGPKREPELFYHLKDKKAGNAEIDFLLQHHGKILPIEVKNKSVGSLKSLHNFIIEHNPPLGLVLNTLHPKIQQVGPVWQFPVYKVEYIKSWLSGISNDGYADL